MMFKKVLDTNNKKDIIAVLDIGTTKVVCLIASIENQKIKVLGIGHQISSGFKSGTITDIKKAEKAIVAAVDVAENIAKTNIENIIVTYSGSNICSHKVIAKILLPSSEISERDLTNLINQSIEKFDRDKYEIIHCFPIAYSIDGTTGIKDPVGMYGQELTCTLNIVTAPTSSILNLSNCLAKCHLNMSDCMSSAYNTAIACLTKDEIELGVTLIDIGGSTTSIVIFDSGCMVNCFAIPIGGIHITSDLAKCLSTNLVSAERVKTVYGGATITYSDFHKMIDIAIIGEEDFDGSDTQSVSNAQINNIISARIEEILEISKEYLIKHNVDPTLWKRIVLTGGSSQLVGIKDLASNIFNTKIRIGKPKVLDGIKKDFQLTFFASAMGVLQYVFNKKYSLPSYSSASDFSNKKSLTKQIINWVKENI